MKRFMGGVILVATCCMFLFSCNEKPKSYRIVTVMTDGNEAVEKITAKNDTDAALQYVGRLEKMIADAASGAATNDFKAMYIISPDGDTLNTNEDLMTAVLNPEPIEMADIDSIP
ncbi:MAG: hypothetical protein IJK93_03050 [Muribaculaceae bacterium]|nr:hypothetical protein [Muribaculaceae bacterium]